MADCPSIDETIAFIKRAHAGQFDKGGEEYWKHPVSVMLRLGPTASTNCKLTALLHDVVEDTRYSLVDLLDMGYPPEVVNAVALLTKPKEVAYLDAIRRIIDRGDAIAIAVKIADNQDNLDPTRLERLPENLREKTAKYHDSMAMLQGRTKSKHVDDKAVDDFTRVCEQTGLIDKLRKE